MKISFNLWWKNVLLLPLLFVFNGIFHDFHYIDISACIVFYIIITIVVTFCSVPVLLVYLIYFCGVFQKKKNLLYAQYSYTELFIINAFLIVAYSVLVYYMSENDPSLRHFPQMLLLSTIISTGLNIKGLNQIMTQSMPTINETYYILFSFLKSKYMHQTNTNLESTEYKNNSTKITIKLLIIAGMTLLLLIPTLMIENLITERKTRSEQITDEVSEKWAKTQTITTPYLTIPYTFNTDKNQVTHYVSLPTDNIVINGNITPETRHRSIFSVLLYKSALELQGNFHIPMEELTKDKKLQLDKASICMGITDFKGIKNLSKAIFNNQTIAFEKSMPATFINSYGLSAPIQLNNPDKNYNFSMHLDINGSNSINFLPVSQNTNITLQSSWPYPSSVGNILPTIQTNADKGFISNWKLSPLNSAFSKTIYTSLSNTGTNTFGMQVLHPTDNYTSTLRCIKYAILLIGLTFTIIFLLEITQNNSMHPVQYLFIGFALCIFYTLLLSFAEFSSFAFAYTIASLAILLLISFYAKSQFKSWKIASGFGGLTALLFSFMYILVNLEDTALIVGSIALFLILAIIMYATRKINWTNPLNTKIITDTLTA